MTQLALPKPMMSNQLSQEGDRSPLQVSVELLCRVIDNMVAVGALREIRLMTTDSGFRILRVHPMI
ncbi:hypothetical protein PN498_04785 [Oscillatoria sp. CS-180]|uniref:hypothetical protein n=1 Tax=Oscillatoria sp. CS-180 TaxID=3021720 RepID=UPI00232EDED9|nr:hypothetical protein [Oscillatoria sp. CS-180]MDB9525293.1 hypothetical protein [Oscillatoria sp. CS-180]